MAHLTAYCMKTKTKNCPMHNIKINKNGNRYMAEGDDGKGNKMFTAIGKDKADSLIKAGHARWFLLPCGVSSCLSVIFCLLF
jgi:hypothetical protein